MAGKRGGERVPGGIYLSLKRGELVEIPEEGGILSGGYEMRYLKAPIPLVMILGPLIGLAYVIFLPLIGILAVGHYISKQAWDGLRQFSRTVTKVAIPSFQPGVSYLARQGRQAKKASVELTKELPKESEEDQAERRLKALLKEAEERRQKEE